jgi:tetratricopeptide (TPR) repeat protein
MHNWGLLLSFQAVSLAKKQDPSADTFFALASQKYNEAIDLNPKDSKAYFLWGNLLLEEASAKTNTREIRDKLLSACKQYEQSFAILPNNFQLLYNWGFALLFRAKIDTTKEKIIMQAAEKFKAALQITNDYKAILNYAVTLSKLARLKSASEAGTLFSLSYEKFSQCAQMKPKDFQVYCKEIFPSRSLIFYLVNWANTLYRNARMVSDDPENYGKLLSMSATKYGKSLQIKYSNMDALYNWGKVLTYLFICLT